MPSTLAYVLHTRPWRETSLLVDALTEEHGRMAFIAKGAKRPHSPLRGFLEPFTPVMLHYTGRSALKNLIQTQWVRALNPLDSAHALAGWYLSELCLRGLLDEDPNPAVFAAYDQAMQALLCMQAGADAHAVLRTFECKFLQALGVWPYAQLTGSRGMKGQLLDAQLYYTAQEGQGWRVATLDNAAWCVSGAQIAGLQANDELLHSPDKRAAQALRMAMRAMLAPVLRGQSLSTREVWKALDALNTPST